MNKSLEVLQRTNTFRLSKHRHRKSLAIYYVIQVTKDADDWYFMEEVRAVVDPKRNRAGRFGTHWKFRELKDAQRLMSFLSLKWP
jgi:hypothetical protein